MEGGFVLTADDGGEENGDVGEGKGKRYVNASLKNVLAQTQAQSQAQSRIEAVASSSSVARSDHAQPSTVGNGNGKGKDNGNGNGNGDVEKPPQIEILPDPSSIRRISGYPGAMGSSGYLNRGSGWADAAACVEFAMGKLRREDTEGRVRISAGRRVTRLLFSSPTPAGADSSSNSGLAGQGDGEDKEGKRLDVRCTGVLLSDGSSLKASLVILATGAWTPMLVDLRGRATATGQVLAYVQVSEEERVVLSRLPVVMNMTRGMFVMPPPPATTTRMKEKAKGEGKKIEEEGKLGKLELKIARHGFGYRNLKRVRRPPGGRDGKCENGERKEGGGGPAAASEDVLDEQREAEEGEEVEEEDTIEISVPETSIPIPYEGELACREMLRDAFSHLDPDSNPGLEEKSTTTTKTASELKPEVDLHQLAERPFSRTRLCWYCDTYVPSTLLFFSFLLVSSSRINTTPFSCVQIPPYWSPTSLNSISLTKRNVCIRPNSNFLITYHPSYSSSLFLATGGSGHGFKFFPVIGEKIVDALEGRLEPELEELWGWDSSSGEGGKVEVEVEVKENAGRGGRRGMDLGDEVAKLGDGVVVA